MFSRRAFAIGAVSATAAAAATWKETRAGEQAKGTFPVTKSDADLHKLLSKEQYYVLRDHGTERAFSSPLDKNYAAGEYHCAGCKALLFTSDAKFDSGTGWPSFFKPVENAVGIKSDRSFFMVRTEVHCATCGGHLGHVFPDGPAPTGQRYCMNGVAMTFVPKAEGADETAGTRTPPKS
ncbi:MAG: peptide-methionine (R)-S-oxide reductase MsrB [Hyphomicrobiaceae bacterium]